MILITGGAEYIGPHTNKSSINETWKRLSMTTPSSINLGNGNGFSVKEVIHSVERVTCKSIKVLEVDRRPGDPPILVGSADKARKILHWQPQYTSLDEIIKTAWHWQSLAKKR